MILYRSVLFTFLFFWLFLLANTLLIWVSQGLQSLLQIIFLFPANKCIRQFDLCNKALCTGKDVFFYPVVRAHIAMFWSFSRLELQLKYLEKIALALIFLQILQQRETAVQTWTASLYLFWPQVWSHIL